MKDIYYANGYEYKIHRKCESSDHWILIRAGGFVIVRSAYELIKSGLEPAEEEKK